MLQSDAIVRQLVAVQRQRRLQYLAQLGVLSVLVGYYTVPQWQWSLGIIGALSFVVGIVLAILRHQRRTWHAETVTLLLDKLEQMCAGAALLTVSVVGLLHRDHLDAAASAMVWGSFVLLVATLCGERLWQRVYFPRLEPAAQLRYLCRCRRRHWLLSQPAQRRR